MHVRLVTATMTAPTYPPVDEFTRTSNPAQAPSLLDLFSTSQSQGKKCYKNAPFICIPPDGEKHGQLYQTCCNDWLCPRCGEYRAKFEYGRMVEGARKLAATMTLYMMTVTLPGTLGAEVADKSYLTRTNRLHSNIRYRAKTDGLNWHYAAVTERQRRGHPHTHYLTTFCPKDAYYIVDDYTRYCKDVKTVNAEIPQEMRYTPEPVKDIDHRQMFSIWLSLASVKAGLGVQCRMAVADVVEGASRYMAAYLFKQTAFQQWPKGWKRVRYSQNWPKMPHDATTTAFPVLSAHDWAKVAALRGTIETKSPDVYRRALLWLCSNVLCTTPNPYDLPTN